jgi:hypothetical protein
MLVAPVIQSFTWADVRLPEYLAAIGSRRLAWRNPLIGLAAGVLSTGVLLSAASVLAPGGERTALGGFLAGVATMWAVWRIAAQGHNARHLRALHAAPLRAGSFATTLSRRGIASRNPLSEGRILWPAILPVHEAPDGIALKLSAVEVIALPDAGLPDGIDRAELLRRIAVWRGA